MKIQSINLKSKRNTNIFVAVTDVGEFELHSDIIVKNGIKIGIVNDNYFFDSVKESAELIAFNLCVKYISSKLKTEKQIKDYLYKHEFHKDVVDAVIEKLKEYKIIDDKMYAETYIRSNDKFSKNKVKQKLMSVGVKNDLIGETTNEIDDLESCIYHAEKYLRNKVIDRQTTEKLFRRLTSMGYTWETIKSTLNKLKCDITED